MKKNKTHESDVLLLKPIFFVMTQGGKPNDRKRVISPPYDFIGPKFTWLS